MYELPVSFNIDGIEYHITNKGDYRMILDCFAALEDVELSKDERLCATLIIFFEEINSLMDIQKVNNLQELVNRMYSFFNCGQAESPGMNTHYKLIDWEQDSHLICSAINDVARTEIRTEPYIHWWTFMGYYTAVGKSLLSTVISIRYKIANGKKLEKNERDFKRENPAYFIWKSKTVEQNEADELVKQLWNSNSQGESNG